MLVYGLHRLYRGLQLVAFTRFGNDESMQNQARGIAF